MKRFLFLLPFILTFISIGCSSTPSESDEPIASIPAEQQYPTAVAMLEPKSGSDVMGRVDFTETPQGLQVDYRLSGLPENKKLGFHIHERGDCSSTDAKSAGKHYIEVSTSGGTSADSPGMHAGDLPPLRSDVNGFAMGTYLIPGLTIDKANAIEGRAIVAHAGPDDTKKKSAPRIACGVIEVAVR